MVAVMLHTGTSGLGTVIGVVAALGVIALLMQIERHLEGWHGRLATICLVALAVIATVATVITYADGIIYMTDTYCVYYWFDIFTCWPW